MGLACDQSEVGIASHEAGSRLPIHQGASQECVIEDISSPQCPFAGGRRSHAPGSQRVSNEFRPGLCSYYHFRNKVDILTGILDPLLDEIDELLEQSPERFPDAERRWEFMLAYTELLLSNSRAVAVLAIGGNQAWMPEVILKRIEWHRARTIELTILPGMSDEAQVEAMLLMDMLHREIVFEKDRAVVNGMPTQRRREIVYAFIRESLER